MKKWKNWLKLDISQFLKGKTKRLSLNNQIKLIQLMNNLFASGFQLSEIIDFLERSKLVENVFLLRMRQGLENGQNLSSILKSLKFSNNVVTQLALAERHGNISETMLLIENNLRKIDKVKKKFIQVATYPAILLFFLLTIMLGMKNYLIPQVETNTDKKNFAMLIITNFPSIFLGGMFAGLVILFFVLLKLRKNTALKNYRLASKIPILKDFIVLYLTAYFSREWGILISQGLDLKQILELSSAESSKIFSEVGQDFQKNMLGGLAFHKAIKSLNIFTKELPLMVEYGEMKGKLGRELRIYSDECWEKFFQKADRLMQLIQPLVFLFVALAIILIYVAMLLPIYQNIDIKV